MSMRCRCIRYVHGHGDKVKALCYTVFSRKRSIVIKDGGQR